jgi:hypothetical protein
VVESQSLHDPWPEVLDQGINLLSQPNTDLTAAWVFQVDGQTLLVAIASHERGTLTIDKRWTHAAHLISTFYPFNLDHLSAHVSE